MAPGAADCAMRNMMPAARVESYRGFVFANLVPDGLSLQEWLGPAKIAFDDMCDRAPGGEVEVVPTCFRVVQNSNWKIFLENQLDALHPAVTHESTGAPLTRSRKIFKKRGSKAPLSYHYMSAFYTTRCPSGTSSRR